MREGPTGLACTCGEAGDVRRRQLPPLGEPGSQTPAGIPAKPQGAPFIDRMLLL